MFERLKSLFVENIPEVQSTSVPVRDTNTLKFTKSKKPLRLRLQKRTFRVEALMKNWKSAVAMAEDDMRPRREYLYRLYHSIMDDGTLLTQIRTARFTVQLAPFEIVKAGKDNEKLKRLFETPWFNEMLEICVDTEFYGHSLVELTKGDDGKVKELYLIPREHVRPEVDEIVLDVHDETGMDYSKGVFAKTLLPIGKREELGLLKPISKGIIRKDNNVVDWSIKNEKFGMPFTVIKTATRDQKELDEKEDMARNFGSNMWIILDDQDEIELVESKNTSNGHLSYKDFCEMVDREISMLVNGQTSTVNEKAHVGSAEVHERILNTYTLARMRRIQYYINFTLFPFLKKEYGYPLTNVQFEFTELRAKDNKPDPKPTDPTTQKKKTNLSVDERLTLLYNGVDNSCGCDADNNVHQLATPPVGIDLDKIMRNAINKVYKSKANTPDFDADLWKHNVDQLWSGFQKGAGKSFMNLEYRDPSYEMLAQFKNNIMVFAAFKNHTNVKDMVAALIDPATGKPRSKSEFMHAATQLNNQYNKVWLETEHATAIHVSQDADKWRQFQEHKEHLPYLQYKTQNDDKVRPTHEVLHDVCKHIDDPFWNTWYPRNGWGCRCYVLPKSTCDGKKTEPTAYPDINETPAEFRHNAGKTKELFPQSHPYYDAVKEKNKETFMSSVSHLIYKNYDEDWKRLAFNKETGAYLVTHKKILKTEKKQNQRIGRKVMNHANAIELIKNVENVKSPDALIDGFLWEFKTISKSVKNGVQSAIKLGKQQADRILIEILSKDFKLSNLTLAIHTAINRNDKNEKVKEIALLIGDRYIRLSKAEIKDGSFVDIIKKALQ